MAPVAGSHIRFFNWCANGLAGVSQQIPQLSFMDALVKKFAIGSFKTFAIKPAVLIGEVNNYFKLSSDAINRIPPAKTILENISFQAKVFKPFASAFGVISDLPGALKAFSKPILVTPQDHEKIRNFAQRNESEEPVLSEGPALSPNETFVKKFFSAALWGISLGDAVNWVGTLTTLPSAFRYVPVISVAAGTYMSLWGLYEEWRFSKEINTKNPHPRENYYSLIKGATSASYLFYSIVGGLGIYFGKNGAPKLLVKAQFWGSVAAIVVPVVQGLAETKMQEFHKNHNPHKVKIPE